MAKRKVDVVKTHDAEHLAKRLAEDIATKLLAMGPDWRGHSLVVVDPTGEQLPGSTVWTHNLVYSAVRDLILRRL